MCGGYTPFTGYKDLSDPWSSGGVYTARDRHECYFHDKNRDGKMDVEKESSCRASSFSVLCSEFHLPCDKTTQFDAKLFSKVLSGLTAFQDQEVFQREWPDIFKGWPHTFEAARQLRADANKLGVEPQFVNATILLSMARYLYYGTQSFVEQCEDGKISPMESLPVVATYNTMMFIKMFHVRDNDPTLRGCGPSNPFDALLRNL